MQCLSQVVLVSLAVFSTTYSADYLVFKGGTLRMLNYFQLQADHEPLLRALIDNARHGIVAGLSWGVVLASLGDHFGTGSKLNNSPILAEIAICVLIGSFVDLDHFISAKTINIEVRTLNTV